jgi:histidinol phosphatase-like PHP family hydrolase
MTIPNRDIAELLVLRSEAAEDPQRQRAYRRAARAALMWPVEVTDLVEQGGSPNELHAIGTKLSALIRRWLDDPPEIPERPPLRRDFMSFAEARTTTDDSTLQREVKGDLQMHTVYSDGAETIEDMARAAIGYGYSYIAITDHSKGLKIAGGMDEEELATQQVEIERLNEELADEDFRVLKGLEMNLNPRGEGDMNPEALRLCDLVLGSFHSKLRVTEDQTDRYIAALRNPDIHVLGHPRGRIYDRRAGLNAEWDRVFAAAADNGKAVEIDAYPDRQDLSVPLLELARENDVYISIGTDAHDVFEMQFLPVGIAAAIRAGVDSERVLNLMTAEQLLAWTKR